MVVSKTVIMWGEVGRPNAYKSSAHNLLNSTMKAQKPQGGFGGWGIRIYFDILVLSAEVLLYLRYTFI